MKSPFRQMRQSVLQNKTDCLAILLLAGWPLLYFWQAALRQAVFFFGDIFLFFYPTHLAYAEALRQGRLPLWDPRMLAGFPLYAEGQIGALYPLHPFLYGLFPIDVATNYDILLHLAWVAVGMYLYARSLKCHPASAFLAAATFAFGGFFVARLAHMSVLATASWLPWLMWAFERHELETGRKQRACWWALLALFSGIQLLGGHPQFALMSALLLGLYSVLRWKRDMSAVPAAGMLSEANHLHALSLDSSSPTCLDGQPRGKSLVRMAALFSEYLDPLRAIPVILAFVVGALIAAVQLLPTFELSTISDRAAGLLPKFFVAFSLRPIHYLMLFNPFLLGNPYPRVSVEVIGYVGLLPLILAIGVPLVKRDRRVVFFGLIALGSLFLGLGSQNVFYQGLRYLPLFNYFRVPSRFFFLYSFAVAILAATTFEYLLERARVTSQWTYTQKIALGVTAVGCAAVAVLVPAFPLGSWLSAWVWLPVVLACFAAWLILGARRRLFARTTLATLVLGVTLIDLGLFASVYSKTYNAMTSVDDFYRPPSTLSVLKALSPQDGRVLTSTWIYPWMVTMRASLYPNVSLIYGIPSAGGYTPLLPQRTGQYLESMNAPMMNLMNVRYYLMPQVLPVDAASEGDDLKNIFAPEFISGPVTIPPTTVTQIQVISSLAQSVDWRDGEVVAEIRVVTQDGQWLAFPLRAGIDTAEWAYDRSDVRQNVKHSLPPIATTFPAVSAFPTEAHVGHNYLAQFDVTRDGKPVNVTGIAVFPRIAAGLLHIERLMLVTAEGTEISLAHLVGRSDQTLVYRTNEVAVFENHDTLPRAFLVHEAHVADDQAALTEMVKDDFNPLQTLILASGTPLDNGDVQRADESVRMLDYQPERVVLSVQVSRDAYLLLADTWYSGWIARVDGVQVPIHRADFIFRAVHVDVGWHRVELEYRPMSLYLGAAVSVMALICLAGVVMLSRR